MSDGPAERDAGLEAFVEAIEAALRSRRGREHVLSPRDFALARGWHEAGVPLATVLVAIDAAFERDPHDRQPGARAGGASRSSRPGRPGRGSRPARPSGRACPRWRSVSTRCASAWSSCPGGRRRCLSRELAEVSDLVAVASRPNWDYLRERLRRIDELVAGAAVEALAPADAAALREEAARAAERHRGKVDEARARGGGRAPPAPARPRDAAPAAGVDRLGSGREHPVPGQVHAAPRKRTPSARSRRRWICGPGPPRGEMRPPAPTTRCQGTRAACASGSARSAQPTARAPRGTPSMTATWP